MKLSSACLGLMVAITTASLSPAADVSERAVPNSGQTQPIIQTPSVAIPAMTVEQRLAAMQQQITLLQSQVAALQSVIKISPTGVILQGSSVSILSNQGTVLQSEKGVTIAAGQGVTMQSQSGTSLKSGASILVEAQQMLDLKGSSHIRLNGGGKPIATVGSAVGNGKVMTGSPSIFGN